MQAYLDLLHATLLAPTRGDRTGVGTHSVFGKSFECDLRDGFPILTTKKIHWKSVVEEMLWFLRGSTNAKDLNSRGVTIWDEWADEYGNLGPIYGHQWRNWGDTRFDQIRNLVLGLEKDPMGRRHVVTAWNPYDVAKQKLPPCHLMFMCYVSKFNGINILDLQMIQRSADVFLGVPFNIASYALLMNILCAMLNARVMERVVERLKKEEYREEPEEMWHPGRLKISFNDLHLYLNHVTQAKEQILRAPRDLPKLKYDDLGGMVPAEREFKVLLEDPASSNLTWENFRLDGYDPHAAIKAPVAV